MEPNSFEINLVVDYYEKEIARLQNQLDTIHSTMDEYERALRVRQKLRKRMKELQDLEEIN